MKIVPGNAQHIGARAEQQDAFDFSDAQEERFAAHGGMIAVLADGMGGLAMGADASRAAVDTALTAYGAKTPDESVPQALDRAVRQANKAVCSLAEAANRSGDVGTTMVAVVIHQGGLHWISVGDSRLYLYRDGRVWQMSEDHDYARELDRDAAQGLVSPELAASHPDRNALVSFLGLDDLPLMDRNLRSFPLRLGDRIILCSDGIYGPLRPEELAAPLAGDPQEAAVALVKAVLAKRLTHQDNCTVAVFAVEPDNTRFQGVTGVPGESLTLQLDRDRLPLPQTDCTLRLDQRHRVEPGHEILVEERKRRTALWIALSVLGTLALVAAVVLAAQFLFKSEDAAPPPEVMPGEVVPEETAPEEAVPEDAAPEALPAEQGQGEEQGGQQGAQQGEEPQATLPPGSGGATPSMDGQGGGAFGDEPAESPEHLPDQLPDKGSGRMEPEAEPALPALIPDTPAESQDSGPAANATESDEDEGALQEPGSATAPDIAPPPPAPGEPDQPGENKGKEQFQLDGAEPDGEQSTTESLPGESLPEEGFPGQGFPGDSGSGDSDFGGAQEDGHDAAPLQLREMEI